MLQVHVIPCLRDNYAYLLGSPGCNLAVVVDPSEKEPVKEALQASSLQLTAILCTHHHYDHIGGVQDLLSESPNLPVYGSAYDLSYQRIPSQSVGLAPLAQVDLLGECAVALHIPGHTMGALAYYFANSGLLFTGDTLFGAGCGRLFEGTPAMMQASLQQLMDLPGPTKVYCGHEYTLQNLDFAKAVDPDNEAISLRRNQVAETRAAGSPSVPSTIEEEAATNPFVRWAAPALVKKARSLEPSLPETPSPAQILGAIRAYKDRF